MKFPHRRQFLHLAAGAAALSAAPRTVRAQAYPTRPVRILVGFAAGGLADTLARLTGQWLSERLSQSFIIENRPGAGGNIATGMVVNAPPDGHTLLLTTPANINNAALYDKTNFNFVRDIASVAAIIRVPNVMAVHPSLPVKTVPEFIAYAKANPGKVNFASGGVGTGGHLSGELLKAMAGLNIQHVPYRGAAPALTDLLGGQVPTMFADMTSVEHIRTGKLRALAVTTSMRSAALPEIPSVGEFVPGYEASGVYGLGAPKNTPAEIINKLNKEINAGFAAPKMKATLADLGGMVLEGSPANYGQLIVVETEKWGKVIRAANIKAE
jgi:tripartite-type tricarboxylate transporter receptor subunit TctC